MNKKLDAKTENLMKAFNTLGLIFTLAWLVWFSYLLYLGDHQTVEFITRTFGRTKSGLLTNTGGWALFLFFIFPMGGFPLLVYFTCSILGLKEKSVEYYTCLAFVIGLSVSCGVGLASD